MLSSNGDALERCQEARSRAEARLEAAELELERAHHLLDTWGVPRETLESGAERPQELSLEGRLELLPDEES